MISGTSSYDRCGHANDWKTVLDFLGVLNMKVSKIITNTTVALAFFSLGCAGLPEMESFQCEWGLRVIDGKFVYGYWCDGEFGSTLDADLYGYFVDPILGRVSLDGTTAFLVSTSGNGVMRLRRANNSVVVSQNFQWVRSGSDLFFQNPGVISQAFSQGLGQTEKIEFEYKNIEVLTLPGLNVLNGVLEYSGQGLASSQISWYCDPEPFETFCD